MAFIAASPENVDIGPVRGHVLLAWCDAVGAPQFTQKNR